MKKRIGAILLTICMLVGLLPTAAFAADTTDSIWQVTEDLQGSQCFAYVSSWEELEKALNSVPDVTNIDQSQLTIRVADFVWPESADGETIDLVLDYPLNAQKSDAPYQMPRICLYSNEDDVTWEIPEHINLTCYENLHKDFYRNEPARIVVNGTLNLASEIAGYDEDKEIVVNGTLRCMSGADLDEVPGIIVNDGGTLIADRADLAQKVTLNKGASMEMGSWVSVFDLTVHSGAEYTYTGYMGWYLFGTLTLDDGVTLNAGPIKLWTSGTPAGSVSAAIVADGTAVLNSDITFDPAFGYTAALTLQGNLTVGAILVDTNRGEEDESRWGYAEINVPAGSYVKASFINEDINGYDSDLTINVAGTLEFGVDGGTRTWKIGDLTLGETAEDGTVTEGTVILRPSASLFADYTDEDDPVSSKIRGNGTIKMYARVCPDDYFGWGWYPSLFGWDAFESDDPSPLYEEGYIADTVTIWRNWDEHDNPCTHEWDEGVITKEPTENKDGEKLYTCTKCGTEKVESISKNDTDSGDSGSGDSGSGSGGSVTDGYTVTFHYPEDLCTVSAESDGGVVYHSGDTIPAGTYLSYDITNIASGYRIKSVTMNGEDDTDGFVNGAYGSIGTSINENTTITVELELIPEVLPTVESVTLYMDSTFTELAPEQVTVDSRTRFFGKATYSDGEEYPAYYIGGVWEYSVDGVNWVKDTEWGRNRFDYWPGWSSRFTEETKDLLLNGSYDLRLRVTPKDLYATGDAVLSNVIHINGGASTSECEHKNTVTILQKDATCGEAGYTGDTWCNDCGQTIATGTSIPATGNHTSNGEKNCTKDEVCTVCGEVLRAAGSHTSNGEKDCTKDEVCTVCGEVLRAAGSHTSNGEQDCTKDEVCTVCGEVLRAAGSHTWNDGEITTPPTGESDGVKTFTCTVCGATRTEPVSRLASQDVSWTVNTVTWTYGQTGRVNNDAYNDSEGGGALRYTSSAPAVATVNDLGRVTIVGAGTAVITATAAAVENRYAETSASYTLTVKRAALTVTAGDRTIVYGEVPANGGYTATGFVNGEDESVLTGETTYTCAYEQFDGVGDYPIGVSGLEAKNYDITFVPGNLTVAKATDYTITPEDLEQVTGHTAAVTVGITPSDSTAVFLVEYEVKGEWTQRVPDEAGEYALRISLVESENIALDGRYTHATLVVKNGVTVDGENIDASVSVDEEGKAALTIGDPDRVAGEAEGDVTIDLDGISGASELELPATLITGLSENENAESLTVTTEDAAVKLSGEVLDTVANAVKSGEDTVNVRLTAVEHDELDEKQQAALDSIGGSDAVIVEVSLVVNHADGSSTELHELGGNAEITVPYSGDVPEGKYIVVSYVSDDGSVSYVRATYDRETGRVTFRTSHFSLYALFLSGSNAYDLTVTGGSGSGTYLEGSTVTVKAESRNGYTFTGWVVISGDVTLPDSGKAELSFTMPAGDLELKAIYTENSSGGTFLPVGPAAPAEPSAPVNPFVDVPAGSYYESAVLWCVEKGITTGMDASHFAPDFTCTRAELVTFLWRMAGCPVVDGAVNFSDVEAENWYTEAVRWAAAGGIVMGYDNGCFGTGDVITREQVVTILYRYARGAGMDVSAGGNGSILAFNDASAVSGYAAEAMEWAVSAGIVQGDNESLMPKKSCTRAQIVTMLHRLAV